MLIRLCRCAAGLCLCCLHATKFSRVAAHIITLDVLLIVSQMCHFDALRVKTIKLF